MLEVFKMYSGRSALPFNDMFEVSSCKQTRGHDMKLVKHRCRLDLRKYFFSERVVDRWNRLDQQTIDAKTVNSFKKELSRRKNKEMGFFMDQ